MTDRLSTHGAGRIGVIEVIRNPGDDLTANIPIKPNHFHIPRAANLADYVARHAAHIAFD